MHFQLSLPQSSQFLSLHDWTLTGLAIAFINLILVFSVVASVFQIFIGGFSFILSGGDPERTKKATRTIWNALIGLLIVFSVYSLMHILSQFLGVDLLYLRIISINQAA